MANYMWRWYDGYDFSAQTKASALKQAREAWKASHYGRTPAMQAEKIGGERYRVYVRIKQKETENPAILRKNPRAGVKLPRTGHTGFLRAKAVDVVTRNGKVIEVKVKR